MLFLERRPEFIDIGKWAISLFILRQEIDSNLFGVQIQDNGCYRYLFDKMDASWEKIGENKVSFITFNYDRSLEHFLFTTIQNTYGKNDAECTEVVRKIPVVHVHGSLGKLPWNDKGGIAYGANLKRHQDKLSAANAAASTASKQIKVIPENQSTSDEFEEAHRLLSEAEQIYFLGFGYNPINLERLQINNLPLSIKFKDRKIDSTHIQGTAKGLELSEVNSVKYKWLINLPDNTSDSLLFLRKYVSFD